jgi:hypothetical protein
LISALQDTQYQRLIATDLAHLAAAGLSHRFCGTRADGPHAGRILHIGSHSLGQFAFDAHGKYTAINLDPDWFDPHEMRTRSIAGCNGHRSKAKAEDRFASVKTESHHPAI